MKFIKRGLIGGAVIAAVLALLPGAALANTNWSASSAYGTADASMTASGRLAISLGANDTQCDSKSAGTMAYIYAGGSRQQSPAVADYSGCHTGQVEWFYYDISQLGGNTSGYVTLYSCRVQRILGGDNYSSCSTGVSRLFTIS